MKTFFILILALLAFFRAPAQVTMELALDQDQFLPGESLWVAVKISNQSGQQLHLGADPDWLTFSVEAEDDFVVPKTGDVPVVHPFDLESSQMGTKSVDLQPYFQLNRPGRYKVTATMRIKEWSLAVSSAPVHFDVINGAQIWSQNFGVTVATNAMPEARTFTLLQATHLRELKLYAQVSSADGRVLKVAALGPLVSFSSPEEQVDRISRLHVLWQTGAQSFTYIILNANGTLVSRDIYDNFNSRPGLSVNSVGDVVVKGGVRRQRPGEAPAQLPPATSVPPAKP